MFPFDIEDAEGVQEDEFSTPTEYEINFETGQLTGKIVEGLEAIKVWACMALKADRYYFQQYSWGYGCELESLIGKSYSDELIKTEAERMITECLIVNKYISGITNFECTVEDDTLTASFTVITDYGEVKLSV